MSLPKELEEVALLDGCNRFRSLEGSCFHLQKQGIVSLVIFKRNLHGMISCGH